MTRAQKHLEGVSPTLDQFVHFRPEDEQEGACHPDTRGGREDPWRRVFKNDLCDTARRVMKLRLKVKLQFHRGMEISSPTRWDI